VAGDAAGELIGTKLGNYRVDSVLGQGGMSVMYRATDVRLGRKVALKVIGEHLGADAEFRERFVDEARNTSAIDHANIVPVYDFGELDGMLYIAMRLVDGSDLASRIGGEPMEPWRAVRLLEQVADALDTLHERGLVHLDMKPANVLVTGKEAAREHVYLADFGLTRRGATGHRTRGGDFLGSPTYAAPEHLRDDPLDGRTDQYALACVAYACLSGGPPFSGEVSAVIKGHLNGQPPPVSRATGLSTAVDDALEKGMAKDPEERYASCAEFVAAVGTALQGTAAGVAERSSSAAPGGAESVASTGGQAPGLQPNSPQHSGDGSVAAPGHSAGQGVSGQVPPGQSGTGQAPSGPPAGAAPPQAPPHGVGPPPGTPPPGMPQAPPPGAPQPPPPGVGPPPQPGAGTGYPPYGPVPGRPAGPGQTPAPPPGYGPPPRDPWSNQPTDGGGSGAKKAWIIGGAGALLVIIATVLVIVFVGGGDDSGESTAPGESSSSAPDIPVGPGDSPGNSGESPGPEEKPPESIPIEPGD